CAALARPQHHCHHPLSAPAQLHRPRPGARAVGRPHQPLGRPPAGAGAGGARLRRKCRRSRRVTAMTAEVRTVHTAAEQAIVEHFEQTLASLPGGPRVRAVREKAFGRFRTNGLPHRRIEEWKYTDLRALVRKALPPTQRPADDVASRALTDSVDPLRGLDRYRLVMADGFLIEALSDVERLAAVGVEVASLATLLAN